MNSIFSDLLSTYPSLGVCKPDILAAFEMLKKTYSGGNKLLVCGNGGSAADSEHIVGELMKSFLLKRQLPDEVKAAFSSDEDGRLLSEMLEGALPSISLVSQSALMTAFSNDKAPELVFAQQVMGYLVPGDTLLALTTSGNSRNCVLAAKAARALGGNVISITGEGGGNIKNTSDVSVNLPAKGAFRVQELTMPVYHALCASLEAEFFNE